jgi:hypothetical protein
MWNIKYRYVFFAAVPLYFNFLSGCKPKREEGEIQATERGPGGQKMRCNKVLPSVERAAIQSLRRMVSFANDPSTSSNKSSSARQLALRVSLGTKQMLENMMRSPSAPIHPVAFYAAVKDFESATNLEWSTKSNGTPLRYFRTGNCTSGECFGLFQVDVKLEPQWGGGAFCQGSHLNLWSTVPGGGDFCAAQFWWISAQGGRKCEALSSTGRNPCIDRDYTWTLSEVKRGRAAYVQAVQPGWNNNAWAEMYKNYEKCYTDREPLSKAIERFKVAVGLSTHLSAADIGEGDQITDTGEGD